MHENFDLLKTYPIVDFLGGKAQKISKKVYHLKKVDGKWELILKEGAKVIKKFDTKEEAMAYSEKLAENQNGTLLVHASKGKNKGRFMK